jgi:DNA-binding NarL/FixJ family response regulator
MPEMAIAFIEIGFFGEAMLGCLERLRKLRPQLRIVLFTVSCTQPDDAVYYLHWSGGSFISLRDGQEQLEERLKAVFRGETVMPEDILREMGEYDRLPAVKPNLTFKEIEVVRSRARGKTRTETAHCLNMSIRTADNHLENVRRKFGIRNIVDILRLAVSQGILPVKELLSGRLK